MEDKLLSISIAAYNVEQFLSKTLESLLVPGEYLEKLDVIVVNDGSTDGTARIALEFASGYPNSFRVIDKENGGYGSTINESLKAARGRYYKLLDGDDWFDRDALVGLLDYLATTDADLVVSPFCEVRDRMTLRGHHAELPERTCEMDTLSVGAVNLFQMHSIAVKTEVLRQFHHPIAEHCYYTDMEYVFCCLAGANTIARCGRAVYCYRLGQEGQSVSLEGVRRHYRDLTTVAERICQCYDEQERFFRGARKAFLEKVVEFIQYSVFSGYMVLEDAKSHKSELQAFDAMIARQYPLSHRAGAGSRIVRTARWTHFRFYPLLCRYARWKFLRG